jgi:ABC-2 type transport system permease protein
MNRLATLVSTEARLLARDSNVLVFAFAFPALCMLILAGVFGSQPDDGFANRRPDDYYVAASLGVPVIALALVGLPVALASYRERGVLRRLEAFGVSTAKVVVAQAVVTCGLIAVATIVVLVLAAPTYGIPHVVHPAQTVLGLALGTLTLLLIGIAVGLAVPTARAAQATGCCCSSRSTCLAGADHPRAR